MTDEELDILLAPDTVEQIERHIHDDPQRVALSLGRHGALIATQIKYLQRARTKMPTYYAARCLLSPIAFEQASSEAVAAEKHYSGDLCLDLTCGLGVDALHFSRTFRRVVAVESDPIKARIAQVNFERMGVGNVTVVCSTAEEFIASFGGRSDLIYVDPARRDRTDRKVAALEDCSPDVSALMPRLNEVSARVVVKLSPLFDVSEAFRRFGSHAVVSVISLRGECKEVLIECDAQRTRGLLRAVRAGYDTIEFDVEELQTAIPQAGSDESEPYEFSVSPSTADKPDDSSMRSDESDPSRAPFESSYAALLVPDVSLCKARLVGRYARRIGARALSDSGYCLCPTLPDCPFGTLYPIDEVMVYHPKTLKKELRRRGINRCNLLRKDFPVGVDAVARALGIAQGGTRFAALCRIDGLLCFVLLGAASENTMAE